MFSDILQAENRIGRLVLGGGGGEIVYQCKVSLISLFRIKRLKSSYVTFRPDGRKFKYVIAAAIVCCNVSLYKRINFDLHSYDVCSFATFWS